MGASKNLGSLEAPYCFTTDKLIQTKPMDDM